MDNKQIANQLSLLAKLMELHGESAFKYKTYANAYLNIRKWPRPLKDMDEVEIGNIPGLGKSSTSKIMEYRDTGKIKVLEEYKSKTPEGILEMIQIKGLGPKKVKAIRQDLGIETPGELLYACNENRLVDLKGFGVKTQASIADQLQYYMSSRGKYLLANVIHLAEHFIQKLISTYGHSRFELTGEIRRRCSEVTTIDIISDMSLEEVDIDGLDVVEGLWRYEDIPIQWIEVDTSEFEYVWAETSSSEAFWAELGVDDSQEYETEDEIFEALGLQYIEPELREDISIVERLESIEYEGLITVSDIKGVVHAHSQYSDGVNSLEEMAKKCIEKGYEYLVITDHSQSAFYAGGMKEEDVIRQHQEIDLLNQKYPNFKIYKGIESDILYDGSLDYHEDILQNFEVIIASIHSTLKMDKEKATSRLITAIENPYTHILGHPTGRLLLARQGYPIDHEKLIDACAANGVCIELNANPNRLDLDWRWIQYAVDRGVMISINPDAHSTQGIEDIQYGVYAARKGGLTKSSCLNARGGKDFLSLISK